MRRNVFLVVLIAIIYLIDAAHSDCESCDTIAPGIPRCNPGDSKCVANIFNQIIQNALPGYGLPDLCPYRPYKNWTLATTSKGPLQLIYFNGIGSFISLEGLRNLQVLDVTGFGPGTSNTCIEANVFIPCLVLNCYFDVASRTLLIVPFNAKGDLTAKVTNVTIHLSIKTEVVVRCGRRFLKIVSIKSTIDFGGFHVDFRFRSQLPLEKEVVNTIINTFWRWYKDNLNPYLEKYTSMIVGEILDPIVAKLAIEDFFRCLSGQ